MSRMRALIRNIFKGGTDKTTLGDWWMLFLCLISVIPAFLNGGLAGKAFYGFLTFIVGVFGLMMFYSIVRDVAMGLMRRNRFSRRRARGSAGEDLR
jgi:hypothetical protein